MQVGARLSLAALGLGLALLAAMLVGAAGSQQSTRRGPPAWREPARPFHIVGPIYHVGTKGLAAYLIRTRAGLILIDGTLEENVPTIEANIRALGFRLQDVKLLLNSHAHYDHAAGLAALKRDTGAKMLASAGDRQALETGRPPSEVDYGLVAFPPVRVDRVLDDRAPVKLGEVALTPVITPGHTPGCTTWLLDVIDQRRKLRVIFPCSLSVAGNKLVGNKGYPEIVRDFRRSFATFRTLRADVVLPHHPELGDIWPRAERAAGGDRDAFIAPDMLPRMVDEFERLFAAQLAKEEAAAQATASSPSR